MRSPSEMVTGIIYLAVNRVNGKLYVGKTGRTLPVRIREHLYDSRNKGFTPFTRAVRKHGIEAFTFTVLEVCPLGDIDERERYWIAQHNCRKPHGYNLTDGGNGGSGTERPDTAERNRVKVGPLNPSFGRKYTAEERRAFGRMGPENARFGVEVTPELRRLISQRTKEAMARPEVRSRLSGAKTKEHRQNLSIAKRAYYARLREEKAS